MHIQQGTVQAILNNQKDNPLFHAPTLQILSYEKLSSMNDKHRIKATLSDSLNVVKCIFSTKYTPHFDSGSLRVQSVIKIGSFEVRKRETNVFVYVTEIEDFWECENVIGNPTGNSKVNANVTADVSERKEARKSVDESTNKRIDIQNKANNIQKTNNNEKENGYNTTSNTRNTKQSTTTSNNTIQKKDTAEYTKISHINPSNNRWIIKARVTTKSDIRTFTNARGEGKVFSFNVTDESGSIKITCFSECVDIFHPLIEQGRVYTISNGAVKMANKKYATGMTDYELWLEKHSAVEMCFEDTAPKYFFKFTKINELVAGEIPYDVIGVVVEAKPAVNFVVKATGKDQVRRDVLIMDETGNIRTTLWGQKTELEINTGDILALNAVSAREYNGTTLSTMSGTQVHVNPDVDECFELNGWYEQSGKHTKIEVKMNYSKEHRFVCEAGDVKWSTLVAQIMYVKEDTMSYDSCNVCNKKVVREDTEIFRCEKCNAVVEAVPRYMVSTQVADFTGQIYVTWFDEVARELFGMDAVRLKEMESETQGVVRGTYFVEYVVDVVSREEVYNGEARMKFSARSVARVDYVAEAKSMLGIIRKSISN